MDLQSAMVKNPERLLKFAGRSVLHRVTAWSLVGSQLKLESEVAPDGRNDSVLDFQVYIIIRVNDVSKTDKFNLDFEVMIESSCGPSCECDECLLDERSYFVLSSFGITFIRTAFLWSLEKAEPTARYLGSMTSIPSAYADSYQLYRRFFLPY